ncbi:MAG: DUF5677 domain-containing protein [Acidobacteriota bacterium]
MASSTHVATPSPFNAADPALTAAMLQSTFSLIMNSHFSTLADEGFLADEVAGVVDVIRQKYFVHLFEVRAINSLMTGSQYSLQIHAESAREMVSAALYVRSLAHCQAAMLLLERGMAPSARALIRCALEGLFNLGACASDSKLALSFLDADQVERKRRAKYLAQVQDPSARARVEEADMAQLTAQIQAKIDAVEAKELRTREMAKAAGLEDLYLTAYAMLSGAVHSSVGDLDEHFSFAAEGQMPQLLTEPVVGGLEGPLLILAETMIGLVRAATKVFSLDITDRCEEHLTALQRLYQTG